jgi:hypothetical protein
MHTYLRAASQPLSLTQVMMSGRHPLQRDPQNRIFIDRQPRYFQYVLDYLRNDCELPANLPADPQELAMVRREFDYFLIPAFEPRTTRVARAFSEGRVIKETLEWPVELAGKTLLIGEITVLPDYIVCHASTMNAFGKNALLVAIRDV